MGDANTLLAAQLEALSLMGCTSLPVCSTEEDLQAKSFQTREDTASLYIYRNEDFGGAIPMTVIVNNRIIGQTIARTYFRLNLAPGLYRVESVAENTSALDIVLEAGRNQFIWQEARTGTWMAGSRLQQVDEPQGRQGVLESRLAQLKVPEAEIRPSKPGH